MREHQGHVETTKEAGNKLSSFTEDEKKDEGCICESTTKDIRKQTTVSGFHLTAARLLVYLFRHCGNCPVFTLDNDKKERKIKAA